jgi:hypothetical protein
MPPAFDLFLAITLRHPWRPDPHRTTSPVILRVPALSTIHRLSICGPINTAFSQHLTQFIPIVTRDIIRGPTSGTRRDEISIASLLPPPPLSSPASRTALYQSFTKSPSDLSRQGLRQDAACGYSCSRATWVGHSLLHFVFSGRPLNPQRGKITPPHFLIPGSNRPHALPQTPSSQRRSAASVLPKARKRLSE